MKKEDRCLQANAEEGTEVARDNFDYTGAQSKGTEAYSERRYQRGRSIGDSAVGKRCCWHYIPYDACLCLYSKKNEEGLLPCDKQIRWYLLQNFVMTYVVSLTK